MDTVTTDADTDPAEQAEDAPAVASDLVQDELLVEEVSIDGMCGVY